MLLLITLYLALVIVLPLALSAIVSYRTLPRGRACPLCRNETFWMRRRWLAAVSRLRRHSSLQRRWCATCGWEGVARVEPSPFEEVDAPEADWLPMPTERAEAPRSSGAPDEAPLTAMRVRRLEVDGRSWSVLLQCWSYAERWYGRLLFVGPSGQRRADPVELLDGRSPDDLIGKARALPEVMLRGRVRDLITD